MSTSVTCPYCQAPLHVTEAVGARPFVCPHCLSNIENPQMAQAGEAPNLVRDIRRDSNTTYWVLGVLIALCVVGVAVAAVQAHTAKGEEAIGGLIFMALGFGVLDILGVVTVAILLSRGLLGGRQVISAGRVLGVVALTLGLGLAIFVFFFAVCAVLIQGV